jgi:hypothetical protein
MSAEAVLVFARAPVKGEVKSRLAAALGEEATLRLYRAFLSDTLEAARRAASLVLLAHTPSRPFPEMARADVVIDQRGRSFGERFDAAIEDARAALPRAVSLLVVGADTPHLSPFALRLAFGALRGADAVLGPSQDGGFHLIGLRRAPPPLAECFDVPRRACARVEKTLREGGLETAVVDETFDVDTPEDLQRLDLLLRSGGHGSAGWVPPATSMAMLSLKTGGHLPAFAARPTAAMPDSRA